jgi:uncharacterized membrane protein
MTFEEKYGRAIQELEAAKIWKSNYNPPLMRLFHKLGLKVRLPHYNSFLSNLVIMGTFFGFFFGLLMYFDTWRTQEIPVGRITIAIAIAGICFGVSMAVYYKYSAYRNKLTSWEKI